MTDEKVRRCPNVHVLDDGGGFNPDAPNVGCGKIAGHDGPHAFDASGHPDYDPATGKVGPYDPATGLLDTPEPSDEPARFDPQTGERLSIEVPF